ncbi:YifB family Mg chelatase-like AAA ATPase [Roseospira navarrensis]|uniref:YifB family Mg chelatase-like AAA ATPase n=1 Tax=Roseospira navarrensis TaxID=140058 RepID=A0A7X1ZJ13_9PROT|nr:YifB family Mg chelatase-like AAA ATPase [Roseospira navarrensis]MQX38491.1 YifB family Mg chelatase-like AAA ATPase [Roseospira navarrensis]
MVARVHTVAFSGIEVLDVQVQVSLTGGLPAFIMVGLPDKAVAESRERVRAALTAIGLALPPKRIIVNLAPADLQKEGSHYDLPVACAVLAVMGVLPAEEMDGLVVLGELGLDGSLAPVAGVLPAALAALRTEKGLVCPGPQGGEAAWAGDVDVLAPDGLLALINHFKGSQMLARPHAEARADLGPRLDLADVKGQESARRALEIAAAGGHNMLMTGPPGAGKSMLAARLPGILPPLAPDEALAVSMIHSVAGLLDDGRLITRRPFRDPHHSASMPALVGGGLRARPGEISLAHTGVLFLDELPEFSRPALEALRQPLETGQVSIARANNHVTYPARVQLIAAMNPCRCGYLDDPALACSKAPGCGADYRNRLSGPLLDRIDLHVTVPPVDPFAMDAGAPAEPSAPVAARVRAAREAQADRAAATDGARANAHLAGEALERVAGPDAAGRTLMAEAAERLRLSARAYHRLLRVARTLADLEGRDGVGRVHIAEALGYRQVLAPAPGALGADPTGRRRSAQGRR